MAKSNNRYRGIYKKEGKTGTSYGIDYIHPLTGQRVKKILKGVSSIEEALKLRSIEIADASRGAIDKAYGLKPKTAVVSFEAMTDSYLKWSKDNKKSWDTDEHRAKPLKKAFKGKLMSDINPFIIEKYKSMRAKSVTKATVNKELITGSQIFEKVIEWEKRNGENPFKTKKIRFKIKKGKKPGALSPGEVKAIRDEITHEVKRDMVDFAFNAGWRISEIRKLKWDDTDIEAGTAWIIDPKNTESVKVELNDVALEILKRQQKRSEYVFCHKNGKPFKTNLHGVLKNAVKRAGVYLPPRKAWHILRRTWASMFLQGGGDVETLRVLGNWKDISMPLWYAEAGDSEYKKKALNKIPRLDDIENEDGRKMEETGKVVNLNSRNN